MSWQCKASGGFLLFLLFPPTLGYGHTKSDFGSVPFTDLVTGARKKAVPQNGQKTLEYGKHRSTKCEKDIWAQTSQLPCFRLWRTAFCFVNGTWSMCMCLCVCVRAVVYELSHCFHFRRNKINPFDIPALSFIGCNSWWILQIWQRVLSALKLRFSTNKIFAGRSFPTLVRAAKVSTHFKPEEEPVSVFSQLSVVVVKDMASLNKPFLPL